MGDARGEIGWIERGMEVALIDGKAMDEKWNGEEPDGSDTLAPKHFVGRGKWKWMQLQHISPTKYGPRVRSESADESAVCRTQTGGWKCRELTRTKHWNGE